MIARILTLLCLALVVVGCSPAAAKSAPRETARAVVLATATALDVADTACAKAVEVLAKVGRTKDAIATGNACGDAYDVARPALLAAARSVDAWDAGERKGVICGLAQAAPALEQLAKAIEAAGATLPPAVVDGLRIVGALGACS